MLINCPECEHKCSEKAFSCPSCGYPFRQNINNAVSSRKSNRKKRLPNGFGQISEIKGQNLRKRFRAMVTVGKDGNGRPIVRTLKPIAYFETYNEAYEALLEYNKDPYYIAKSMTMQELFDKWYKKHSETGISDGTKRKYKMAWDYCHTIYDMQVGEIRARHIRGCIEEGYAIRFGERRPASEYIKKDIKIILGQMLDFALEDELVKRNYAKDLKISIKPTVDNEHIPFTDEEMTILWQNLDLIPDIAMVLIQCYTGWRPRELINIKVENVNITNRTMIGGMKTEAGRNRTVPIHHKIIPFVANYHAEARKYNRETLFDMTEYYQYSNRFSEIVESLGLNPKHRPHDCRVQFVTMAKKYNVDEYAIKRIVGHAISDLTEQVYTHRDLDWLISELEKIK